MHGLTHSLMMAAAQQGSPLVVGVSATLREQSGTTSTVTSASVSCTTAGGVAPHDYQWARIVGSAAISATAPAAATTSFTASGLAQNEARVAIFRCAVADAMGASGESPEVEVRLARTGSAPAFRATPAPSLFDNTFGGSTTFKTGFSTISTARGTGPYTYSWFKSFGDAITIDSPSSYRTRFTASGMSRGEKRIAAFRCAVTDTANGSQDITITILVLIERVS